MAVLDLQQRFYMLELYIIRLTLIGQGLSLSRNTCDI